PSTSSLFPYTTLFRSADLTSRGVQGIGFGYVTLRKPARPRPPWVRLEEITGTIGAGLGETVARTLQAVESLAGAREEDLLPWHLDRKSTRLNSSHVSI